MRSRWHDRPTMKGRHELAAHPDECEECRRTTEAGEGEPEWEHLQEARSMPEYRSSV